MPSSMARVPVRDTKPERALRDAFARLGITDLEFNVARLPGQPDVILPKAGIAAFAHGCYWHNHQGCRHGRVPGTSYPWARKFERTRARDAAVCTALVTSGYRVLTVWQCGLLGAEALPRPQLDQAIASFLRGTQPSLELEGRGVLRLVHGTDTA